MRFVSISADANLRAVDQHGENAAEPVSTSIHARAAGIRHNLDPLITDRVLHFARLHWHVSCITGAIANGIEAVLCRPRAVSARRQFERHEVSALRAWSIILPANRNGAGRTGTAREHL